MPEFSLAAMERLLRKAGNDRVSKDAPLELAAVIESLGEKIAEEAIRRAEQEEVKTISRTHIKKAAEDLDL